MLRISLGARALLLIAGLGATAYGLDPNRRLTQYVHTVWQTEQGLPQAINAIGQTTDGYLWLGTYTGLVRFDGVRFTTIPGENGILDNVWIRSLVEDSERRLWLGTNGAGLFELRAGGLRQYTDASGLPSNTVYCVVRSRRGDVWACTPDGIARLTGGRIEVYRKAQGLPANTVYTACEARDGTLWTAGEGSRLGVWDGAKFRTHALHSVPPNANAAAMLCSSDGSVWSGTGKGLVQLKDGKERLFTTKDGLADGRILCLTEGRDGSLWIGTQNGFSRLLDESRPRTEGQLAVVEKRGAAAASGAAAGEDQRARQISRIGIGGVGIELAVLAVGLPPRQRQIVPQPDVDGQSVREPHILDIAGVIRVYEVGR